MHSLLASPLSYLFPSLYLLGIVIIPKYKISNLVYSILALMALASNIVFNGVYPTLRALGLSTLVFLLLILTGVLSRAGTYNLSIVLLSLPIMAWAGFLPGFFFVGLVSAYRLKKATSSGYLTSVAHDTLSAIGALDALNGRAVKPDLEALPLPSNAESSAQDIKANKVKMNLNLYLGSSILFVGLFAYYKSLR